MTRLMHENSLSAWRDLDTSDRCAAILAVYRNSTQPLTDRMVMEALGFTDGNAVKPRISEMVHNGYLCEVGKVKDHITKKSVRVCVNTSIA